jgi:hypothetical protein
MKDAAFKGMSNRNSARRGVGLIMASGRAHHTLRLLLLAAAERSACCCDSPTCNAERDGSVQLARLFGAYSATQDPAAATAVAAPA